MDYTTLCSPWMVGIKLLITESRNLKSEGAIAETVSKSKDDEEPSGMKLLSTSKEVDDDAVSDDNIHVEPEKLPVADLSITED